METKPFKERWKELNPSAAVPLGGTVAAEAVAGLPTTVITNTMGTTYMACSCWF
jgi:hypothetical protein